MIALARTSAAPAASDPIRVQHKCACGAKSADGICDSCAAKEVQRKLAVGATNDPLEHEADRVADEVMRGGSGQGSQAPVSIRRAASRTGSADAVASNRVEHVLSGAGQSLDPRTRSEMEQRFGHDFSRVRIHDGNEAAHSARELNAHAYTAGNHIVFDAGRFAPATHSGRRLLAHELTHVVQQAGAAQPLRRKSPAIGSKFEHPAGAKSALKSPHGLFDGQDFILKDGTSTLVTHAAQSGRPVSVRAPDAKACKGSTADSYLNNSKYVGIKDFGAIPEGDYTTNLSKFSQFSAWEQAQMITGGYYTDPFGSALHGGDWGSGRGPLTPKSLVKSTCGNVHARSGFYLHGGSLPGSSGCIDIDNDGMEGFFKAFAGFRGDVPIKVKYTHAAPSVGLSTRGVGRFTYPTKDGKPIENPSIWERFGSALGGD